VRWIGLYSCGRKLNVSDVIMALILVILYVPLQEPLSLCDFIPISRVARNFTLGHVNV